MNLIYDKNIFPNINFLKDKFNSFIDINNYNNQDNNVLLLPLKIKEIPDKLLLNNQCIFLFNNLENKHVFKKNIYYFPDEISFYIMKHSSKITTNISCISKLFPQSNFNPFLINYPKINFSNLFIEINIRYFETILLIVKPLIKHFKKNNVNLLFYNKSQFVIYNFFEKKFKYQQKDFEDFSENLIGLLPFSNNSSNKIGNIYYLNQEEEQYFSNKFESYQEDYLDFENYAYFITPSNFYKIHKNNFTNSNLIQNENLINPCSNLNISPKDNLEYYFFNNQKSIPLFTIFIISIGNSQLEYTLKSIEKLNKTFSFIVNFIYKISPTSKAYGQMPKRCKTKYFIQCDEDMILNEDFLENIFECINKNKNNFLYISALYDKLLGVTKTSHLWGIKTYDNIMLNYFNTVDETEKIGTSSVDRYWHQNLLDNNLTIYKNNNIEGIHAYYRESDEFFLKIAKVTNNIFYGINKEDDNLRFIKVLKDFNPNLEFCQKIFLEVFKKRIDMEEIRREIFQILDNSKTYQEKFLENYFLTFDKINQIKHYFGFSNSSLSHFNKINLIGFLGFIYGYYKMYNYDFSLYPTNELNIIKEKIGLNKNLVIISSQIPNFGGAGTNALTLKNYFKSHFINTFLLIVDEDEMYPIENDYSIYSQDIIICTKHFFKKINEDKLKELFNISQVNLIINRNPQSKFICRNNFKKKFPNIKILNFVGGGVRIYQDKIIQPFYSHYQNIISQKNIEKTIDVLQPSLLKSCINCDYIITNSLELENLIKILYPKKTLGTYYSSFINKNTSEILFNYKDFKETSWENRKYDILFVCSNFKREIKNVDLFIKLTLYLNKKILIIGKNVPYLGENIESLDFTDNLKPYYLNSKLVINTSFYDSSPSVIMEGLFYGCNILITKNVGNFELYHPDNVIQNYTDEREWVEKIEKLTDKRSKSLNKGSQERISRNLLDLIDMIVEKME